VKDLSASYNPNLYHIWITALVALYEGKVIQGLVTKGYSVTAASGSSITITSNGSPSSLIALRVEKENITAKIIYEDIVFILTNMEAKYYSIIVS
jgi:hypothetical protein